MLKSNQREVQVAWVSPNGETAYVDAFEFVDYKRKQHSKYSWSAKNFGKDLIYQTRLRIAERMGLTLENMSDSVWSYVYDAHLGIVLH